MPELSPFTEFFFNEIKNCWDEEGIPDYVYVDALAHALLKDDTPPHVVALIKELQAHLT